MNIEKILAQKRLRILLNLKEDLIEELRYMIEEKGNYPYNKLKEALDFAIKNESNQCFKGGKMLEITVTKDNEPVVLTTRDGRMISKDGYGLVIELTTTEKIKQWAMERGLDSADPKAQMVKLMEELGELAAGMNKNNRELIIDSIGDVYVVLTILALQLDLDIEDCIESAYNEIKNRKGKMVNGVFVKKEDLK